MKEHTDILVIGAGISGLTAAWKLHQGGRDVHVLEATDDVGGCMRSEHRDGYILEKGPFNVIVRAPAFEQLLDDFADDVRVVTASRQAGRKRFVLRAGRLMVVPSNPISLLTSPLLSLPARLRLLRGLIFSRPGREDDTIDAAATRRFGPEFAEVLVSAMVAGIVAGDSLTLHLRSCFPSLARIDRRIHSPLGFALKKALTRSVNGQPRKFKGLISFENGLGALPRAIARRLGARITLRATVTMIQSTKDGYSISYHRDGRALALNCRQLILATPVSVTAAFLKSVYGNAASRLESIDSASLVVVNLGLDATQVDHPLQGYGFLVPRSESDFPLLGVLFADSIFPHHAPAGHRLIRVFMGGMRDPIAVNKNDSELLEIALIHLRKVIGLHGEPQLVDICRSHASIPQYGLAHDEMIKSIHTCISAHRGLHLTGNFMKGVSINDCIGHAARLAKRILSESPLPMRERFSTSVAAASKQTIS